ncbi:MAG TPA: cell division protein FtsA [Chloroflexota bacterium]|nr:cell division protein FtsA [Chloroflexota bacterium]
MAKERVIVGVDVGTTKICALIGEVDQDNRLNIVGVGVSQSQGLRKGMVVNIDEAAAAIREALDKTERISGYKIGTALVGIAGSHITSQNSRGIVAVSPNMHEISQHDIDRAIEAARAQPLPPNREILHVIPREYVVDGENGIHDPLGMSGNRLEVETHIVSGAVSSIHNLIKCVEKTGIEIDDIVLEPLASSEAVLTSAERDLGVAMIDIGGGTTDLAIFINGSIWHTAVIGVGGNHLTNDIAVGLRTPFEVAEEMKRKYGTALAERIDVNEMIKIATFDNAGGEPVSRRFLCEIIEARVREMFVLVQEEIRHAGYQGVLPAGIVLTGGSSQLTDLCDLARDVLQMPARVGGPAHLTGLVDSINSPAFSTSVGLLSWGLRNGDHNNGRGAAPPSGGPDGPSWRDVFSRFSGWLKHFWASA